ncbi:pyridoxamine 5'-phosphate oxidase family protein [Corynebacterium aquilae]|uniref:Pyridoxamine 5-phosphate oxidase n=1 Tax=Corynebacterium aquilae DSM 44791 TaxID=1431546 RepID=A0A1L7CHN8_9CORY|nr:pyridoxamine 5'-phosphate oxidase family protein [Corynebacterium aquilae]APT85367.1 pyridoxamine 5-phosphate oxidase [Corynebacterium aquilae DSM 44791]
MSNHEAITVLDRTDALNRMSEVSLGRIVVRRKDDMDIFPVNYVIDNEIIYLRTAEGNKLFSLALNNDVLFEADHVDNGHAWSVVVKGRAEVLKDAEAIHHADSLPLKPWVPTLKYNYVTITPTEVSGREFDLGEEPERY